MEQLGPGEASTPTNMDGVGDAATESTTTVGATGRTSGVGGHIDPPEDDEREGVMHVPVTISHSSMLGFHKLHVVALGVIVAELLAIVILRGG